MTRNDGMIEITIAELALVWGRVYGVGFDELDPREALRSLILDLGAEGIERELHGSGISVRHRLDG